MRHAYCASNSARQSRVEIDTGVVHALLNARYYDSARGQFVSQDPVFWEIGLSQDGRNALSNPQALNSYGYASDNPITNKDQNGRYVEEISRPVASYAPLSWYSHAFLYVVPENGQTLPYVSNNNMSVNTSQPFTLGAYPSGGRLTYSANNSTDYSIASANMSVPGVSRQIVAPPAGMTSAQFDASVVSTYNNLGPDQGIYNPFGWRRSTGLSNSNNANTSLLMNSGVSQSQIIKTSLYASNQKPAPGLGTSLSAPTYYQSALSSISASLKSISATIAAMIKSGGR